MDFVPYSNQQIIFPQIHHHRNKFTIPFFLSPRLDKPKVLFVLGSTGTGKSKLAINLAAHFNGEVVNSDKIQLHIGLDVITNKVTHEESANIPHHLISYLPPDADFSAGDFRVDATRAVESIVAKGKLPIVAGGSNSYIEELVNGDGGRFSRRFECLFIWVDVDMPVLDAYVSYRVDKMVEMGLVEEARTVYDRDGDYTRGIRKAIGVPEMDCYFRNENNVDEETRSKVLEKAIEQIETNTCKLARRQLKKIRRLSTLVGWDVRRVDATSAFVKKGKESEEAWEREVRVPSVEMVQKFLKTNCGKNGSCVGST